MLICFRATRSWMSRITLYRAVTFPLFLRHMCHTQPIILLPFALRKPLINFVHFSPATQIHLFLRNNLPQKCSTHGLRLIRCKCYRSQQSYDSTPVQYFVNVVVVFISIIIITVIIIIIYYYYYYYYCYYDFYHYGIVLLNLIL